MTLRVATFNLFSGRSLRDGRSDPDRLAAAVAELDADVVALQEVDRHQPRSGEADQAALVAAALGAGEVRYVPCVVGTPGEDGWVENRAAVHPDADEHAAALPPGPSYGIALVSRVPVRAWHVLHLDPPRGRWPLPVPSPSGGVRMIRLRDEPRAVVAAGLAVGPDAAPLLVAGTHLSFVPGANARQLRRARRWLEGLAPAGTPAVLLGDLNLPGSLPARLLGWPALATAPTYPAPAPRVQLDHVLGRGVTVAAPARTARLAIGDHLAVTVDLTLP